MTGRVSGERWTLGHRPSLDGVRGVAILMVLLGHSQDQPGLIRGGTVGVTLFFALSGFLITAILAEELRDAGRIKLVRFYLRRALRLLPALGVLVAAVGIWMALRGQMAAIAGDALPVLFYFGNWVNASGGDVGLLSHTWSLSVEEQFYLVWPAGLLIATWTRRPMAWVAILTVALIAFRLILFVGGAPADRLEAGTDTRGDALLLGCLAALAATRGWLPRRPGLTLGLAASALAATLLIQNPAMQAWGYSAAALASVAVVWGTAAGERSLLSWAPLAFLGRISYGLYLWHFPIRGELYVTDLPLALRAGLMLGLTLLAALASWRFVEQPFLRLKRRLRPDQSVDDRPDNMSVAGAQRLGRSQLQLPGA